MTPRVPPNREVVVIEDDIAIRTLLTVLLERHGYLVTALANGADALVWLAVSPPPLCILLDLDMPIMDGRQFRAAQSADPRLATIPVVLMTTHPRAQTIAQTLDIPCVLNKPFNIRDVTDLLATLVAARSDLAIEHHAW